MSWLILVNTRPGHNKYWSAEHDGTESQNFTGRVVYGRIGYRGVERRTTASQVEDKKRAKLRSGYRILFPNAEDPVPTLDLSRTVRVPPARVTRRVEGDRDETVRVAGSNVSNEEIDRRATAPAPTPVSTTSSPPTQEAGTSFYLLYKPARRFFWMGEKRNGNWTGRVMTGTLRSRSASRNQAQNMPERVNYRIRDLMRHGYRVIHTNLPSTTAMQVTESLTAFQRFIAENPPAGPVITPTPSQRLTPSAEDIYNENNPPLTRGPRAGNVWNVLLNRSRRKYWAYETDSAGTPTRRVVSGTVGRRPSIKVLLNIRRVQIKIREYTRNGYEAWQTNVTTPIPRRDMDGVDPTLTIPSGVDEVRRTGTTQEATIETAGRETRINIPREPVREYKTNKKGVLPRYDPEYHRPRVSVAESDTRYVDKEQVEGNARLQAKVIDFYTSIPEDAVAVKRRFGRGAGELYGTDTPKFIFVTYAGEVVGGFEILRNQAVSRFFYLKTNTPQYTSVLRDMVFRMGILSQTSGTSHLLITIKGDTLKDRMQTAYADAEIIRESGGTWHVKLPRSLITSNEQTMPKRFLP